LVGTSFVPAFASGFIPYYANQATFGTTAVSTPITSNTPASNTSVAINAGTTQTTSKFIPYGGYYKRWTSPSKPVSTPAPTPTPTPTPTPAPVVNSDNLPTALTAKEKQMLDLINQERTSRGIKALEVDMRLVKMARLKSQDMITNHYADHQSPVYGSPFDMMKTMGISYKTAGENIAGASTVAIAHQNLMNSPGHRANILSASYTKIGIGIIEGGPYGLMFSQEFIG
jgi:uncharacterized YkwD family protein